MAYGFIEPIETQVILRTFNIQERMPFTKGHKPFINKGRPANAESLSQLTRTMLEARNHKDPQKRKHLQIILAKQIEKAEAGDQQAVALLYDRGFGKIKSEMDITTGNQPLQAPNLTLNFIPIVAK